jgi:predicted metal-dependent hydrolase
MTMSLNHGDFNRSVDLFNRAHFFDAHEVLESVWRSLPRTLTAPARIWFL